MSNELLEHRQPTAVDPSSGETLGWWRMPSVSFGVVMGSLMQKLLSVEVHPFMTTAKASKPLEGRR